MKNEKQEEISKILPYWDGSLIGYIIIVVLSVAIAYGLNETETEEINQNTEQGMVKDFKEPSPAETTQHKLLVPEEPVFEVRDE